MSFDVAALQAELIRDEGLRLTMYLDTLGIPTIGVGRNLRVGISEREAMYLLGNDIVTVSDQIEKSLPWTRTISDARQRALINMGFMGVDKLLEFRRMLAAMQAGDFKTAAAEAVQSKWAQQVGSRAHRIAQLIEEG